MSIQNLSKDNTDEIQTRIFRRKADQDVQEDKSHKRGGYRILTKPEIFGQKGEEYLGKPPQISIHDSARQEDDKDAANSLISGWITVFGLTPKVDQTEITKYFMSEYGEIVCTESSASNYISLEFASKADAKKAVAANPRPIFFGNCATFVQLGKFPTQKETPKNPLAKPNDIIPENPFPIPQEIHSLWEETKRFIFSFISFPLFFVLLLIICVGLITVSVSLHNNQGYHAGALLAFIICFVALILWLFRKYVSSNDVPVIKTDAQPFINPKDLNTRENQDN